MSLKGLIKKFSVRNRKTTNENVDDAIKSDDLLKVNSSVLYTNYKNNSFTQGRQRPICIIDVDYDPNNKKAISQLNEVLILLNIGYDRAITLSENNRIIILSTLNNFVNTVTEGYKRTHDNAFIVSLFDALHEFDESIFKELKSLEIAKNKPYSGYYIYEDNGYTESEDYIPKDSYMICSSNINDIPVIDLAMCTIDENFYKMMISNNIPIISVYTSVYNGISFKHFIIPLNKLLHVLLNYTSEATNNYSNWMKNLLEFILRDSKILKYSNSDSFKNNNSEGEYNYHLYEDIDEIIK